ncbi:hypothetical protein BC962_3272 [Gillisia mitskevichiae]|uniref:Uncharacterized protein n=1 Tax=Gillisia mitskevichiae TaxID=270921 RepID=A0A495NVS9_9FLAO|nr:hypothetical protein BC962_3272 [Gillisia mitskevichiae]
MLSAKKKWKIIGVIFSLIIIILFLIYLIQGAIDGWNNPR